MLQSFGEIVPIKCCSLSKTECFQRQVKFSNWNQKQFLLHWSLQDCCLITNDILSDYFKITAHKGMYIVVFTWLNSAGIFSYWFWKLPCCFLASISSVSTSSWSLFSSFTMSSSDWAFSCIKASCSSAISWLNTKP